MSPMTSTPQPLPIATGQLRQLLRDRRNPAKLAASLWLTSQAVQQKQQMQPELTPVAALLALLDETLAALHTTEPQWADLLRGRFWEGLPIEEMLARQRPEPQSIRRFHQQQDQALHAFAQLLQQTELANQYHMVAERLQQQLPTPTYDQLFGVERLVEQFCHYLQEPQRYPMISVKGIGGIGKTALTNFVIRQHLHHDCSWRDLIWISGKQEYLTASGIQSAHTQIHLATLFDELGQKLNLLDVSRLPLNQKLERIAAVLRAQPHLVVFDNLESVEDFRHLVPLLLQLAGPTQFVLTARATIPALSAVTVIDLDELDQQAAYDLIAHVAQKKAVMDCDPATLYKLVGGNPLAIILVVSQMSFLPVARVLAGVRTGEGADIYPYIYRQAWAILDQVAQNLLFAIQRVNDEADYAWLAMATDLAPTALDTALRHLYDLSLVQLQRGADGRRRYAIHRLTSTFLRTEVLGWR